MTLTPRLETMTTHPFLRGLVGVSLGLALLALPLAASAADWAHKKKLGFDTTASGSEIKEEVAQLPVDGEEAVEGRHQLQAGGQPPTLLHQPPGRRATAQVRVR